MLVIPARTINNLIIHYLQALKKIQLMARLQATIRITGFLLILILTWQYKIIGFIIASLIAAWAVLVVLSRTVYQDLKKQTQSRTTEPRILTYGQWAVAIMVLGTLSQYMDIFMLNFLENDRISFGYYSLATLFIIGLNFFTETVQSIATPYFSEKEKNRREFIRVLRKYTLLLITLAGLVTLVANLCLPAFIVWFYGSAYHSVSTFFRLLSLKYLLWSAYALTGIATFGLGKIHLNFASAIIILPISVALNWHFIHSAGVTGAAWAQVYTAAIAFLLNWTILLYALKQTVKTDNSAAEVDNKQ
jgi:O-antigen/teichoic acid export membrane protein